MARLERAPTYKRVYDAIEGEILSGALRVGDPLPTESDLAEQFGVNRSTVREGVRLLEQSGLIEFAGKRPRITAPRYRDLATRASRALLMHAVTFRELWEASMLLEPAMAELAARNATPEDLDTLAANVASTQAMVEPLEDGRSADDDAFIRLDQAFHEALAAATHNRALMLAHEPISRLFIPAGRVILPRLKTWRRVADAHAAILRLLQARDAAGVRTWMLRHMQDFERGYARTGEDFDRALDRPV